MLARLSASATHSCLQRSVTLRRGLLAPRSRAGVAAMAHTTYSPIKWWTSDTVAVVTGSNKGIGKEVARLLAEQGLTVVATARKEELGRATVKEIAEAAGPASRVVFHPLDVADQSSADALKAWLQVQYPGGITILVNNAGIAYKGDVFGAEELKTTLDTNYHGTAYVTEALLPLLTPGQARIVTVSSRAGLTSILRSQELKKRFLAASTKEQVDALVNEFVGLVEASGDTRLAAAGWPRSMYGVSKLAISMYCRLLADRLKGQGISVAACCPGYCATDMSSWRGTQSAAAGADTPVWLALTPAPQFQTGKLWGERTALQY